MQLTLQIYKINLLLCSEIIKSRLEQALFYPNPQFLISHMTVSELTYYIKSLLETNSKLQNAVVSGEVSNLTYHSSGHAYFSVKDNASTLPCVMFRSVAEKCPQIKNGEKVELKGNIEVYPPHGKYQFNVKNLSKGGVGDLYKQFIELKDKLQKEGLFEMKHKKSLPIFPKKIIVLTSPTGAVIHDIINTIKNRYPAVKIQLLPIVVQGIQGVASIINNLRFADTLQGDVLILARGGGSVEDLWNFNEELVARAIFDCKTPIITGIGHETDTTIADFVADFRAETPTAAAIKAVPDLAQIKKELRKHADDIQQSLSFYIEIKKQTIENYQGKIQESLTKGLYYKKTELNNLQNAIQKVLPEQIQQKHKELEKQHIYIKDYLQQSLRHQQQILSNLRNEIPNLIQRSFQEKKNELSVLTAQLEGLDSTKLLTQGYTFTLKNGKILNSAAEVSYADVIETVFVDGRVKSKVVSQDL